MGKRIYVRPENDCPQPLKSNWPNLDGPDKMPDYSVAIGKAETAHDPKIRWQYLLYKKDHLVGVYKSKDEAKRMKAVLREPHLWIHSHEPTAEQAHEQRQKDKAEWRWSAGFGA